MCFTGYSEDNIDTFFSFQVLSNYELEEDILLEGGKCEKSNYI